jgi:hypothetical protein
MDPVRAFLRLGTLFQSLTTQDATNLDNQAQERVQLKKLYLRVPKTVGLDFTAHLLTISGKISHTGLFACKRVTQCNRVHDDAEILA